MNHNVQVRCQACLGHGRIGGSNEKVCPGCHGAGFHIMQISFVKCTECNGTGRKPGKEIYSCRDCEGKGIVPLRYY